METMYERIKRMSEEEMKEFVYLVYLCGNKDGQQMLCDSLDYSYFGGHMLTLDVTEVMPNDNVNDLYSTWKDSLGQNIRRRNYYGRDQSK